MAAQDERIETEVARLLASSDFLRAPRSAKLLRYLVTEALAGRGDRIKGPSIAMDVFGRDASFDSASDPIVRVQAGRLRALLATHYRRRTCEADVVIEIPKGRYVPKFLLARSGGKTEAAAHRVTTPSSSRPH